MFVQHEQVVPPSIPHSYRILENPGQVCTHGYASMEIVNHDEVSLSSKQAK